MYSRMIGLQAEYQIINRHLYLSPLFLTWGYIATEQTDKNSFISNTKMSFNSNSGDNEKSSDIKFVNGVNNYFFSVDSPF